MNNICKYYKNNKEYTRSQSISSDSRTNPYILILDVWYCDHPCADEYELSKDHIEDQKCLPCKGIYEYKTCLLQQCINEL